MISYKGYANFPRSERRTIREESGSLWEAGASSFMAGDSAKFSDDFYRASLKLILSTQLKGCRALRQ